MFEQQLGALGGSNNLTVDAAIQVIQAEMAARRGLEQPSNKRSRQTETNADVNMDGTGAGIQQVPKLPMLSNGNGTGAAASGEQTVQKPQ